jgi:hypothetical protein
MAHQRSQKEIKSSIIRKSNTCQVVKDKRDNIDELFNNKLNDRSFPIPEAFLDDLNKRLDEKESGRKRKFGFWWLSLVLLPVLGTIVLFITTEGQGPAEDKGQQKIVATEKGKDTDIESVNSIDTAQYERKSIENSASESIRKEAETGNLSNDASVGNQNYSPVNKASKAKPTKKTFKKKNFNIKNNSLLPESGDFKGSGKADPSLNSNSDSDPFADLASKGIGRDGGKGTESDPLADTLNKNNDLTQDPTLLSVDPIPADTSKVIKSDKPAKTNYWEVQVYGGFNYTLSQTKSTYSATLNNMESPILRPQFGAEAYFNMNKTSFGTGLYFHQTGERTRYEVTNTQLVDSVFVAYYEEDSVWNNQTQTFDVIQVPVYDSVSVQQTSKYNYDQGNYYSWITVPLHLRYRFTFGDYELLPLVGVQFHMAAAYNVGLYPDQAMSQFNEVTAKRFYISYSLQAELRRNLNSSFVFIRPQYNSGIMPVISDAILERRYSSWGLIVGYGWKF